MSDEQHPVYLFRYEYNGADWYFALPAGSEAEARERIKAMQNAHLETPLTEKVSIGERFRRNIAMFFCGYTEEYGAEKRGK